ncbi:MAG TPA: hydroxyisourate hydrolase [Vicinamibacterales bacterium]|nr:hydroxyisourate hydrolase [Vicinamibacterales bacterium]
MSAITTHVLDTARGLPAAGINVSLERRAEDGRWDHVGRGHTDNDGRLRSLYPAHEPLRPGVYRLTFDTQRYFDSLDTIAFYPEVVVVFGTATGEAHYHVPLLLSPFGFSTYRGP